MVIADRSHGKGRCFALVSFIALAFSFPQLATSSEDDATVVARQLLKCLKLPPNAPTAFELPVQINLTRGKVSFVSLNFQKLPNAWEQIAAPIIADAVTACEPYGEISNRLQIAITPELLSH